AYLLHRRLRRHPGQARISDALPLGACLPGSAEFGTRATEFRVALEIGADGQAASGAHGVGGITDAGALDTPRWGAAGGVACTAVSWISVEVSASRITPDLTGRAVFAASCTAELGGTAGDSTTAAVVVVSLEVVANAVRWARRLTRRALTCSRIALLVA